MMEVNPAEQLVRLASALESGAPPPESPAAHFCRGIKAWLYEDVPLEKALGLRGSVGIDAARTRYLRAERDRHLRTAHAACEGATPWSRSVALSEEVRRFESDIWPRWRDMETPPANASMLRASLFRAKRAGKLPRMPTRLHSICAQQNPSID